ncbi:MAG: hypothetical protein NY202_02750 [Mollicutes bacterium UO1]
MEKMIKKEISRDNRLDQRTHFKKISFLWKKAGEKSDFANLTSEKISQGKEERDKKTTDILSLVKNESDPVKLANYLEKIEKENARREMEESKENESKQPKEKLLSSDPQAKQKLIKKLKNLLTQNSKLS